MILEAMSIRFGLKSISSLNIYDILGESDCLQVAKLLNDISIDISKISFFLDEVKARGSEMRIISLSHIRCKQNSFVYSIVH